MQDADDPNAVIRNAIKNNPPIERRGHYEETQIAEFPGSKTGARTHFGKVAQEIERLESRIQKGPGGHIVVAPDVIPALDQILINFGGRLPLHGFKSP
jgi:hypothetical protein